MTKPFDRIIIVMFENQYRTYVMQDPFMGKLAAAGLDMRNFFGAFHLSQTNYLASLAGEVCAITNDIPPQAPLMQQTLVDLLEEKNLSWKAYMEGYPGDPWKPSWATPPYPAKDQPLIQYPDKGPDLARYYRKHNAFGSFHTIQADEERWNKIVDDAEFWRDVAGKGSSLPNYSWFTPDIWNDGHYLYNTHIDTNPRTRLVPQISNWLEHVFLGDIDDLNIQGGTATGVSKLGLNLDVDLLLTDPDTAWEQSRVPEDTLIVVTFDEADYDANDYDTNYDGPNQIYTVLLGNMITPGTTDATPFNHYSVIKTVERNFGLGNLGKNDRAANWFRLLWGQRFSWSKPTPMKMYTKGQITSAYVKNRYVVLFEGEDKKLKSATFENKKWVGSTDTGLTSHGPLAMAELNGCLYAVLSDEDNNLMFTSRDVGQSPSWSQPQPLNQKHAGSLAMASYCDEADGRQKIMLCWQNMDGFIDYLIHEGNVWQEKSSAVGQLTDGPMALSQLGASLYLVYKERNTRKLRMTSFNVAPYNSFEADDFERKRAPQNDTSMHQWAPADFPVGHFAKKMAAQKNDYQAMGNLAMSAIDGEMHLIHRGAYEDTPSAFIEIFGLTGIFTAKDQSSNGFGTIDQAGWTLEAELSEIELDPASGISLASDGENFLLVWQAPKCGEVMFSTGSYKQADI